MYRYEQRLQNCTRSDWGRRRPSLRVSGKGLRDGDGEHRLFLQVFGPSRVQVGGRLSGWTPASAALDELCVRLGPYVFCAISIGSSQLQRPCERACEAASTDVETCLQKSWRLIGDLSRGSYWIEDSK